MPTPRENEILDKTRCLADGEVHGLSSENRILIEGSKRAKRRRETKRNLRLNSERRWWIIKTCLLLAMQHNCTVPCTCYVQIILIWCSISESKNNCILSMLVSVRPSVWSYRNQRNKLKPVNFKLVSTFFMLLFSCLRRYCNPRSMKLGLDERYLLKCTVMHRDAPWCTEKQNLIIAVTLPKYK